MQSTRSRGFNYGGSACEFEKPLNKEHFSGLKAFKEAFSDSFSGMMTNKKKF